MKVIDGIYIVKLPFDIGYTVVAVKEFLEQRQMLVYPYDFLSAELPNGDLLEIEEHRILMAPSMYLGSLPNRGKGKWIFYKKLPDINYFNEIPAMRYSGVVFEVEWPPISYWRFIDDLAMKEYKKEYDELEIKQVQHLGLWLNVRKDFIEMYIALSLLKKRGLNYLQYASQIDKNSKDVINFVNHVKFYDEVDPMYRNKIIPLDKC
jgi:hypothetical protein